MIIKKPVCIHVNFSSPWFYFVLVLPWHHGKFKEIWLKNTGTVLDIVLTSVSPEVALLDVYDAQIMVEQLIAFIPETNKVFDRICLFEQENMTAPLYENCHSLVDIKNEAIPSHVIKSCKGRHIFQLLPVPCQEQIEKSAHMRVKRQTPSICRQYKQESYTTTERYCCQRIWGRCVRHCRRTRIAYRRVCDFSRILDRIRKIPEIPRITLRPPIPTLPPFTPPPVTPPHIRLPGSDVIRQPIDQLRNVGRRIRDRLNPIRW